MFSRGLRSETRSKAKEDLKKIVSTIEYVRKWEKKWVHIKDTSLTVYKWIPSAEQNFARHKPKPYQVPDKARFALSGPDSAAAGAVPGGVGAASPGLATVADASALQTAAAAVVGPGSGVSAPVLSAASTVASVASTSTAAVGAAATGDVDLDSVNGDSNMSFPIAGADSNSPANLLDDDTKSESTEFTASQCHGGASEDNTTSDLLSCSQDPSQEGPPAKRTRQEF